MYVYIYIYVYIYYIYISMYMYVYIYIYTGRKLGQPSSTVRHVLCFPNLPGRLCDPSIASRVLAMDMGWVDLPPFHSLKKGCWPLIADETITSLK